MANSSKTKQVGHKHPAPAPSKTPAKGSGNPKDTTTRKGSVPPQFLKNMKK